MLVGTGCAGIAGGSPQNGAGRRTTGQRLDVRGRHDLVREHGEHLDVPRAVDAQQIVAAGVDDERRVRAERLHVVRIRVRRIRRRRRRRVRVVRGFEREQIRDLLRLAVLDQVQPLTRVVLRSRGRRAAGSGQRPHRRRNRSTLTSVAPRSAMGSRTRRERSGSRRRLGLRRTARRAYRTPSRTTDRRSRRSATSPVAATVIAAASPPIKYGDARTLCTIHADPLLVVVAVGRSGIDERPSIHLAATSEASAALPRTASHAPRSTSAL